MEAMRKLMANKGNILTNDQVLLVDDYLVSPNGQFRLVMQSDGNLCVYGPAGWVWGTQATAPGGRFFAVMQSDGNFCVYKGAPNQNLGWLWGTQVTIPGGGRCFATVEDDGSFNVYRGTGPNDNQGLLWGTQSVDPAIIRKFAPKVYLHPADKSHPDSVENYFRTVCLKVGNTVLERSVTPDVLQRCNADNYTLESLSGDYPTAANNYDTGAPIVPTGQPSVGMSTAPVYVKTFRRPQSLDIKYIFFYPFQSFQTFRIGVMSGLSTRKRTFEWARFGRHGGDWEHLTVRLDPTGQRMLGAFYSQHKHCVWVAQPPLVDGTHPAVWAAMNSHACYPAQDVFDTGDVLPGPIFPPISWLKAVDTTVLADDLVTYDASPRRFTRVEWTPYAAPGQLVMLDRNVQADKWLSFRGYWGPAPLSNAHIDRPPALPFSAEDHCFNVATVLRPGIAVFTERLKGDAPKSPKQQDWWLSKEP
jgi:hypothetical protein